MRFVSKLSWVKQIDGLASADRKKNPHLGNNFSTVSGVF